LHGQEVIILESETAVGTGISSRNSEVIHAGIYYLTDSLKARFCVAGKELLYNYCEDHGVPFKKLGKLIVATDVNELPRLEEIRQKAAENGVVDLQFLDAAQAKALEPNLQTTGALLSPSTGIIDTHALMQSLLGDAQAAGAQLALASPFLSARLDAGRIYVNVGGEAPMNISCDRLINATGLNAQAVAHKIDGLPGDLIPPTHYTKGNYFVLSGKSPFGRLIYPVPVPGGLGTHSSIDMAGGTRFGPDVELIDTPYYEVDASRAGSFYGAIRRCWPGLPDGALAPGYAGVRPKLAGPEAGTWDNDFMIQGPAEHGIDGLVNLFGIESPGLTSCLAIGDYVAGLM
jgi:L-2-hydroxyglutarate oxidase LhgO